MKIVKIILDKTRPMFEEDGKLSKMYPLFEAIDNLFFAGTGKTENAPFGRDALDLKRYMTMVIVALMPCMVASIYFFGWRVLLMIIVSYIAGGMTEVLFSIVRKEDIAEGFLVTGLIFPLTLPPTLPLWMVAVGVIFGTLVGKEVFGGTGRNLFNPAIVGRCFLMFSYPQAMSGVWMEPGHGLFGKLFDKFSIGVPDVVTGATPLVLAKSGEFASAFNLFIGGITGSAGETSVLAVLLGGIFLMMVRVSNWRIVFSVLISFAVLTAVLNGVTPDGDIASPVLFSLMSGGILYGAFFMATDPVTGPVTLSGKWVYGILIGSVTVLIRRFSGYVEGITFAILLGNICAPLIDEVIIRARIRRYAIEK